MQRPESLRKKAVCKTCNIFKPIKTVDECQNCWHKFKRKYQLEFFLRTRYTEVVQRCTNKKHSTERYYFGKKYCTRQEFLNKFLDDKSLHELYKNWQKSNFQYALCSSIDRIDNNRDYTIENLQFITHSKNSQKDKETVAVDVYTRGGKFLKSFISIAAAADNYEVQQANAWKVIHGIRKHSKGYVFKAA